MAIAKILKDAKAGFVCIYTILLLAMGYFV